MNEMRFGKRIWLVSLVAVLLLTVLYPFKTTVVPEWGVRVVDESGRSVSNAQVMEHWQHYSIEIDGHEAQARTDQGGYVSFPERTVRASLLKRGLGPVRNVLRTGVHSSFGISAYLIIVTGSEHTTKNADYKPGEPLPKIVVISPVTENDE